jgi:hypothetical protein
LKISLLIATFYRLPAIGISSTLIRNWLHGAEYFLRKQ